MKVPKTNAARLLDSLGIAYEARAYEVDPEDLSAIAVARKVGLPAEQVFKTLLTRASSGEYFFAVIPGDCELDLKKLAAAAVKAACIDIQLTQERDGKHQLPGATVFTEAEMDTIEALVPTLEGKTDRQKNPHPVKSLARATWVVARLGGWNCYYKPPGPITLNPAVG